MPRTNTPQSPLESASPGLRPTARPLDIAIGATPAPSRSPLMELANAFNGFQPELRQMIRDAAAREDQDAYALGEIEAQKTSASDRLATLGSKVKTLVDEGKVSKSRLPAFQAGYHARTGRDLAETALASELQNSFKSDTSVDGLNGVKGPQRIDQSITEAYAKLSESLKGSDPIAAQAFHTSAQGVIQNYRNSAYQSYQAQFEAEGERALATDGINHAISYALAPDDEKADRTAFLQSYVNQAKTELPKRDVALFVTNNVASPAVAELVSRGRYDEARALLDAVRELDVTGKGGKVGRVGTSAQGGDAPAEIISKLEYQIDVAENRSLQGGNKQLQRLQSIDAIATDSAQQDFNKTLLDRGLSSAPLTDEQADSLTREYQAQFSDSSNREQRTRVTAFASLVDSRKRADFREWTNKQASQIKALSDSYDPENLELADALLKSSKDQGLDFELAGRLSTNISAARQMVGLIDKRELVNFQSSFFQESRDNPEEFAPITSDTAANDALRTLIPLLKPEERQDAKRELMLAYRESLTQGYRKYAKQGGQEAALAAEDDVLRQARTDLEKATVDWAKKNQSRVQGLQTRKRIDAQKRTLSTTNEVLGSSTYYLTPAGSNQTAFANRVDVDDSPQVLADRLKTYPTPDAKFGGDLAKKLGVDTSGDFIKAAYLVSKARQGFTLSELESGKTSEGIPFDPTKIVYTKVKLFPTLEELNKAYNDGLPPEGGDFYKIGDLIDPEHFLTPKMLYDYQRALFPSGQGKAQAKPKK